MKQNHEGALLAGLLPYILLSLLLIQHRTPVPKAGTVPSGRGLPTSIINQENALQIFVQASLMGALSQLRFLLSK